MDTFRCYLCDALGQPGEPYSLACTKCWRVHALKVKAPEPEETVLLFDDEEETTQPKAWSPYWGGSP